MAGSPIDPSFQFAAVTPSDTALLTYNGQPARCRAIYIGGSGNLVIENDLGTAVTFTNVVAGTILQVSTARIRSTSTTATNIVALF